MWGGGGGGGGGGGIYINWIVSSTASRYENSVVLFVPELERYHLCELCVGNNSTTKPTHSIYVSACDELSPRFRTVPCSALCSSGHVQFLPIVYLPVQGRASLPQRTHHVA